MGVLGVGEECVGICPCLGGPHNKHCIVSMPLLGSSCLRKTTMREKETPRDGRHLCIHMLV